MIEQLRRVSPRRLVTITLPYRAARLALGLRLPRLALLISRLPKQALPEDFNIISLRMTAFRAIGKMAAARSEEAIHLRVVLRACLQERDLVGLLETMAGLERMDKPARLPSGRWIADLMVNEEGRAALLEAASKAKAKQQDSAFLDHIIALCLAKQGDFHLAAKRVADRIADPYDAEVPVVRTTRHKLYEGTWRVVDQIAREQMEWADAVDPKDSADAKTANAQDPAPEAGDTSSNEGAPDTPFKERALQRRQRDTYLQICLDDFEGALSLGSRLKAIKDMLRSGIRLVPDYAVSYDQARRCLDRVQEDVDALGAPETMHDLDAAKLVMRDLCTYLQLAQQLDMQHRVKRAAQTLIQMSEQPALLPAMWGVPFALHKAAKDKDAAALVMERVKQTRPTSNDATRPDIQWADTRAYFQWAMEAHRYAEADAFFETLPDWQRRQTGIQYYVNILQRQSRFAEALEILEAIHGQILSKPLRVNPFTNYSLVKRRGELEFLIKTAEIYSAVPQPTTPKGLVLIAPRNVAQLRRQPLMVLVELKRQGWAVVPLVEGLLPKESTGLPQIDVLVSSIHANTELTQTADAVLPTLDGFEFIPQEGRLTWQEIDMSHALWEDAAINRRRHSINWHCPKLVTYLGGLANWSKAIGRVLEYTRAQSEDLQIPVGVTSLYSCRLPDALSRLYCEARGNPDTFFCAQVANGYQNYFTNFSTNISQRLVLRNVTRFPQVRSGAFPIPENFERYFEANRDRIPEALERFAPITSVKRSTEGVSGRPPEADALDQRIADWRAKGGKVACAFGKVVCDSGVPFDGGPVHRNMRDWINHCVRAVQGSNTLLLIKPHPHELNNQIATFLTEYFTDLIDEPLGDNAVVMGHRWFNMDDMESRMDVGVVYNGTTTIELGLMGIPAILAGHFGPIDYPIGQVTFSDQAEFEALLRFEKSVAAVPDVRARAAMWLDYMANDNFTQPYRFHTRPVTNKVLNPPMWFQSDIDEHTTNGNPSVAELAGRFTGTRFEPGDPNLDDGQQNVRHAFGVQA